MSPRLPYILPGFLLVAALTACGGNAQDSVVGDTDEATGQLKVQASGLTWWMDPVVEWRGAEGLAARVRVSKNVASVAATVEGAPVGRSTALSARRFELLVPAAEGAHAVLSGGPLFVALQTSEGRERSYEARYSVVPGLTGFTGDRRLYVRGTITPRWVGGAEPLGYRLMLSIARGNTASEVRVEHPSFGAVPGVSADGRVYNFELTPAQLASALAQPSVTFRVVLGGRAVTKQAQLQLTVRDLDLTLASAPFPRPSCQAEVAACLAGSGPAADCGDYQEVRRCRPTPSVATCEPRLGYEVESCVYTQLESAASDPDRGALDPRDALGLCVDEGDLTGPIFDGLCGADPGLPYCACRGQETCFEAFTTQYLRPCGQALAPRFDCVFGLTFRELRLGRANVVLAPQVVLRAGDVLDSLTAEQIVQAVHVSSHNDVTTAAEAFQRVDQGEINRLDLYEGSNGRAYTAFEYGAGDNSYGAIFEYGTNTLVTRIQDGDLYDGSAPPQIGCRIPHGTQWTACGADDACGQGQRCFGQVNEYDETSGALLGQLAPGKCVAPTVRHPRTDGPCSSADPCPIGDGLRCSSIATRGPGYCRPMWMFGRFPLPSSTNLPRRGRIEIPVMVSGLATVPEEALFEGILNSSDFTRVRLTMLNPVYRTPAVIFDGPGLGAAGVRALLGQTSGEVRLSLPVPVPGDEAVNGQWTLRIETTRVPSGSDLELLYGEPRFSLSSRFD